MTCPYRKDEHCIEWPLKGLICECDCRYIDELIAVIRDIANSPDGHKEKARAALKKMRKP